RIRTSHALRPFETVRRYAAVPPQGRPAQGERVDRYFTPGASPIVELNVPSTSSSTASGLCTCTLPASFHCVAQTFLSTMTVPFAVAVTVNVARGSFVENDTSSFVPVFVAAHLNTMSFSSTSSG